MLTAITLQSRKIMNEDARAHWQLQASPAIKTLPSPDIKGNMNVNHKSLVLMKRGGSSSSSGKSSPTKEAQTSTRRTRSQAAPDWTVEETVIMVSEISSVDEDWRKSLSSYQRWKMISDNCMSMDVLRSSNQCKRRWESLLTDYNKIRDWESCSSSAFGSYWSLQPATRKQYRLPVVFHHEVFASMDALIKAQEAQDHFAADIDSGDIIGLSGAAKDDDDENDSSEAMPEADASDSDYLIALPEAKAQAEEIVDLLDAEMAAAADSGSEGTGARTINKAQEMASNLKYDTEQIHALLRGDLSDNVSQGRALVDLTKPNAIEMEFTRRQADDLIKVFQGLASTLDQFTELIKDSGSGGINLNSMTF